ncbi:MAG: hypothetical protein U5L06_16155 [Rhodovibrio sp.]|nr:hypothetical protein [Rhodovibrio sp.]
MFDNEPTQEPSAIGFLLLPRFSLMSLLSAIEPLRGANRTLGRTAYAWEFFSLDGAPVESSSDIPIAAHRSTDAHCGRRGPSAARPCSSWPATRRWPA